MQLFDQPSFDGHESVLFCHDAASGLRAIIAVHSTRLGPAAGGCRMWAYAREEDALNDALRLSRGMTYKSAIAGLPLGGGKAVILGDARTAKTPALMRAFGQCVNRLGGAYYTAEDVGTNVEDMRQIAQGTKFVAGLTDGKHASGDPSPFTARGVYLGMELAVARALGRSTLRDTAVAIQGLGNVGFRLAQMLHAAGARLLVADVNPAAVDRARTELGATVVDDETIYDQPVDVFAPCALGAVLSAETIPRLRARVVAGGANNQLADAACGAALAKRGILYAPDYVINGGGIINVAGEILGTGTPEWVAQKLDALMQTLARILDTARESGRPTHQVADRMVEERLAAPRAA